MVLDKDTNVSYGFVAPNDSALEGTKQEVLFPSVDSQTPDYAAEVDITVKHSATHVEMTLTGNITLNAIVDERVTRNAEMLLVLTGDGATRTVTLGDGLEGDSISVPNATTVKVLLKYDGTDFVVVTSSNDTVQDGAITAAKLATDAVETAKIKDKAVTLAKLEDGTAGDILYFNGTAWTKLAKGTANQVLAMNAGATAPEWVTLT